LQELALMLASVIDLDPSPLVVSVYS
jgi:hypothetical protein